jgi:hypothetical protein
MPVFADDGTLAFRMQNRRYHGEVVIPILSTGHPVYGFSGLTLTSFPGFLSAVMLQW